MNPLDTSTLGKSPLAEMELKDVLIIMGFFIVVNIAVQILTPMIMDGLGISKRY